MLGDTQIRARFIRVSPSVALHCVTSNPQYHVRNSRNASRHINLCIVTGLNVNQSTSFAESHNTVIAYGCKPWVTYLSPIPRTLGITILEDLKKSQVNVCVVEVKKTFI